VRNIQIAEGRGRTSQVPTPGGPRSARGRLRDWLATLPILLLVPALVFPLMTTEAAGPSLAVTPASVSPGQAITVSGAKFEKKQPGSITWDDTTILAAYRVGADGRFRLKVVIPKTATGGAHRLTARSTTTPVLEVAASLQVVAALPPVVSSPGGSAVTLLTSPLTDPAGSAPPKPTLLAAIPVPTPFATPTEGATATPAGGATPTGAPTRTPSPGATPTGAPTRTPSPGATPTGVPTPTPGATPTAAPTRTPTPQPTARPTSRPTATPAPTPTPIPPPPTGWTTVVNDQFNSGGVPTHWTLYDGPYGSGPGNCATPSHATVSGGYMHMLMRHEASGNCGSGWYSAGMQISKTYGSIDQRVTVRFRIVRNGVSSHYVIPMRWPDTAAWPQGGEEDFCEGDSLSGCSSYLHYSSSNKQLARDYSFNLADWHTIRFTRLDHVVKAFIDDMSAPVWTYTGSSATLPDTVKRTVLQQECQSSCPSGTTGSEDIQIDWITIEDPS
jgi:hypothetical protein